MDALEASDPVALAQALIRCPSVTPEEGGALALLGGILEAAGFAVQRPVFSEPGLPAIENLYARIGQGSPCLVFAGHTDVVPPGDVAHWSRDPFSGALEGGMVHGRGACDMKGGVAASVSAVLRHLAAHGVPAKGSMAFLITGDEEGPAVNGTVKLLAWAKERGEVFDHCILGEPTNVEALGDMIKIGRRGSLTGRLVVEGTQGHVAYPHLADNPIRGAMALMQGLMKEPLDAGSEHFLPSNLEFTTIDVGNPASNVIPGEVRATFNVRFNDHWSPLTLETELRARMERTAGNSIRYKVSFDPTNATAFLTSPGPFVRLVSEAVTEATGRVPALSTTGGTSDARFIKDYCPVLEFGLVGQTMHKVDERVPAADIEALAGIYERVLERYFA